MWQWILLCICSIRHCKCQLNSDQRTRSSAVKCRVRGYPICLDGTGVLFSRSVASDSLWPHGLQHSRLPCPSPSPRACSNSCPLSQWCHPTISSSVVPFSFRPQSFLGSGSFPMTWFLTSGGQSSGVSASASVLSMNIQCWFPLGLTGLISLQSKRFSRVFSSTAARKHQRCNAQKEFRI